MIVSNKFNQFCRSYYDKAKKYADITIASLVSKRGPLNPRLDIESVKQIGIISSLEKAFSTYDANNASNASIDTYLSKLVHNEVLTELGKEQTKLDRFDGIKRRRPAMGTASESSGIMPGAKSSGDTGVIFEPHEIMDVFGAAKGKEQQIREMIRGLKQLPAIDQIVLTFWMNAEDTDRDYYFRGEKPRRTYVQRILDCLGLGDDMTNAMTIRCFKAKKKLAAMLRGIPADYEDVYVPGSSELQEVIDNTDSDIKVYTDSQYENIARILTERLNY